MKFIYSILFILLISKVCAQNLIYSSTGDKTPAKFVSISADKVKYKNPENPTGPDYSKSLSKVLIAFNAAGSYLVVNPKQPFTDDEKNAFVNEAPAPRNADIIVDVKGVVLNLNITDEKNPSYIKGIYKGKQVKALKSALAFLIRKNGTHQLFVSPDKAAAYLTNAKDKINFLLKGADAVAPPVAQAAAPASTTPANTAPATGNATSPASTDLAVDMKLFSKKALQKTEEFSQLLNTICSVKTQREASNKSINLACDLFINEDAKVEVSSVNAANKPKYKIRAYLSRLQLRSGHYDKVSIEYANINYASKFTKGTDGNYYAVITFVQKFKGFIDGKVVYGDRTKRNVTIVLKTYEKEKDGGKQSEWDVFLEDMGVVETQKIG